MGGRDLHSILQPDPHQHMMIWKYL